jgi:hypothetical protein
MTRGAGDDRRRPVAQAAGGSDPAGEAYARTLALGTRVGFLVLLATFLIYVLGLLPPEVPVTNLPKYWHLPAARYVAATGAPTGWSWLSHLGAGDVLNFLGIAILALVTPLCYARVLPVFVRERQRAFAWICVAELVVFGLAVAGLVALG